LKSFFRNSIRNPINEEYEIFRAHKKKKSLISTFLFPEDKKPSLYSTTECVDGDGNEWTGSKTLSSGETISFTECSISQLRSEGNGGGIYLSGGTNVVCLIERCLFHDIHLEGYNYGGGIYIYGIGSVLLKSSSFERLSVDSYFGGGIVSHISTCLLVHDCLFDECNAANDIGGLSLQSYSISSEEGDCSSYSSLSSLFSSLFSNCHSLQSPCGGLHFYNPPSSSSIKSSIFFLFVLLQQLEEGFISNRIHLFFFLLLLFFVIV
jgi:hypothetical protein